MDVAKPHLPPAPVVKRLQRSGDGWVACSARALLVRGNEWGRLRRLHCEAERTQKA